MEGGDRELVVGPEAAGERLDVFLAGEAGSRAAAQRLIDAGLVLVDGSAKPKRHAVAAGERVTVRAAAVAAEPQVPEAQFRVAYEDEHLLIVDKPAGVVVHPARGHRAGTLAQALAGRVAGGDDPDRIGIVHRLDRDTSGLLVVARSDEAHRRLQQLLRRRKLVREYLALVRGRPRSKRGRIEAPIGRDRHDPTRVSLDTDTPRDAVTNFEVVETMRRHALLRAALETGRTHQIRVHLAAIDLPVAGDPVYGVEGDLGLARQFLHAARLAFPHPFTGEPVEAESPLPPDLQAALEEARLSS
jgi:23S rRNA pseudouridine1911/1915/1917 synthase